MVKEGSFGKFKYLLYEPSHMESLENLPLIVCMHGSGEIGSSLSKLKKREPYISLNNGKFKTYAYVLIPQLPSGTWGKMAADLKKLVDNIVDTYKCDKKRISLTGHSLGAMGVIEILVKYPNYFSAGALLSCAKNYKYEIPMLAHIPLYFLYGEKEGNYGKYAREMFAVIDGLNEESLLREVKGYGHPIQFTWCSEEYGIFNWLMRHKVGDLKVPTWGDWLSSMDLVDGRGKATEKSDKPMDGDVAKKLGIRMGKY